MSTRYDILAAKRAYTQHIENHGCREGCPERAAAFNHWMSVAALWRAEDGDDERQRKQFYELTA